MHISLAFQILKRHHQDVLQPLTEEQFRFVRRLMIQIVLATDMAGHTELLKVGCPQGFVQLCCSAWFSTRWPLTRQGTVLL